MTWRRLVLALLIAAVCASPGGALARTVHYVLTAESRLTLLCAGCDPTLVTAELLAGSFDVTETPVPSDYGVDAITGLNLRSGENVLTGSGFLQRLGADRMAMVVETHINGLSVLLTSGRRQPSRPGEIRMQLASPRGAQSGVRLTLVAVPATDAADDSDGDGIADHTDTCPHTADGAQLDGDGDAVGDACDTCASTPSGDTVLADGCSLGQKCPCDGPAEDREWDSQRDYVQCVARELKVLRKQRHLSRPEVRLLLQDAVHSGCGRRILALL